MKENIVMEGVDVTLYDKVQIQQVPGFDIELHPVVEREFYYIASFIQEGFTFLVGSYTKNNAKHPDYVASALIGIGVPLVYKSNVDIAVSQFQKRYTAYRNHDKTNNLNLAISVWLSKLNKELSLCTLSLII